jgi:glycosyltransferase involved in cell wall biosynthesis
MREAKSPATDSGRADGWRERERLLSPASSRPLVTVVIPTRDRPVMLRRAVESVVAQTHRPIELIIVDDGSIHPARTRLVRDDLAMIVIRHDRPRGPGAARNAAIAHASGEFVLFLDDDDYLLPDRLFRAVDEIGTCRMHAMGSTAERVRFVGDMRSTLERASLFPRVGQVVFRRVDLVEFDPTMRVSEDTEWWLSMRSHAIFAWSDDIGLVVEQHDGVRPGVDPTVRFECRRRIAEKHAAGLSRHGRASLYNRIAAAALLAGKRKETLRFAYRSLRVRPTLLGVKLAGRGVIGLPKPRGR